ncbi:MAG: DUF3054 domain-containing protein [Halobacteriales archaeon]
MAPGGRVALTRRTALAAAGDLLAIAAFVVAGELQHGGTAPAAAVTFLEFGVAWAVVASLLGAYAADAPSSPTRAVAAWVPAVLLGQGIRAVLEPAATIAPAFVAVSLLVGGALIGAWRGALAYRYR